MTVKEFIFHRLDLKVVLNNMRRHTHQRSKQKLEVGF